MKIRFWGVRGSTPTPERGNLRHGGNTSCIEVRLANGTLIVLDCGSGLRGLGARLTSEFGDHPIRAFFMMTHFHWDHVQGIPFFAPFYKEGNTFYFYSSTKSRAEMKKAIEGLSAAPYFSAEARRAKSLRHYHDLQWGAVNLNGAVIKSAPLSHPQGCAGYRIEADGSVFVLATDTEPGSSRHDQAVRDLARNADLFVYDAQYSPEQLRGDKKGWGHSSWLEATRIAKDCHVKRLLLFHYDPASSDVAIDRLVEEARQEFANTRAAAEGSEIQLPGELWFSPRIAERRRERRYRLEIPIRLIWRTLDGHTHVASGVCQDISRSGIFFVAPEDLETTQTVSFDLIMPDEITHRGEVGFRFKAHTLRTIKGHGTLLGNLRAVGKAARLTPQVLEEASSRVA